MLTAADAVWDTPWGYRCEDCHHADLRDVPQRYRTGNVGIMRREQHGNSDAHRANLSCLAIYVATDLLSYETKIGIE